MRNLKLKYSSIIPFEGYYAINVFGTLIRRNQYKGTYLPKSTMNHEGIHTAQAEDFCKGFIGFICFYIWYFIEWLLKLIPCLFTKKSAYRSISFEQEALLNDLDFEYQDKRKKFAWMKYVFKLNKND